MSKWIKFEVSLIGIVGKGPAVTLGKFWWMAQLVVLFWKIMKKFLVHHLPFYHKCSSVLMRHSTTFIILSLFCNSSSKWGLEFPKFCQTINQRWSFRGFPISWRLNGAYDLAPGYNHVFFHFSLVLGFPCQNLTDLGSLNMRRPFFLNDSGKILGISLQFCRVLQDLPMVFKRSRN